MIPMACTLIGSIGIKAGLDLDEYSVTIDPDAKNIAIKGDNGSGKSTLLNLGLTPWRNPPQIGNVYDHFRESGSRELEWSHNGELYRSIIDYQQSGNTRKQSACLYRIPGNGDERPVGLSDGKTGTYDAELTKILGHQDIYFLSAFRAQGAIGLSEYPDRKALLRSLLGLDQLKELAKKCGVVVTGLSFRHSAMNADLIDSEVMPSEIERLKSAKTTIESEFDDLMKMKIVSIERVAKTKARLERMIRDDLEFERIRNERAALESSIAETKKIATKRLVGMRSALAGVDEKMQYQEKSHQKRTARRMFVQDQVKERRIKAERLIQQESKIRAAEKYIARLEKESDELEKDLVERKNDLEEIKRRQTDIRISSIDLGYMSERLKKSGDDLVATKRLAGIIKDVPCGGKEPYNLCPILKDSMDAATGLPSLLKKQTELIADYNDLYAGIQTKRAETPPVDPAESSLDEILRKRAELTASMIDCRKTAATRPLIDQGRDAIDTADRDMKRIDEESVKEQEFHQTIIDGFKADRVSLENGIDDHILVTKAEIAKMKSDLESLPAPDGDDRMGKIENEMSEALEFQSSMEKEIASATQKIAFLETKISDFENRYEEITHKRKEFAVLGSEISGWKLLKSALLGIVDLTIEAAGPSIAATANHLLTAAYGPRFSLRIDTQREQRNGVKIECFELTVIDSNTGLESNMTVKSGGESVWLNRAISDAVAIYHQNTSGIGYETLFTDETDDGLTRERKDALYRMSDKMLELGNFKKRIFISHDPESWMHADQVIAMGNADGRE
jgi:DNA repair exonuclease SbcCD ATPase subunit